MSQSPVQAAPECSEQSKLLNADSTDASAASNPDTQHHEHTEMLQSDCNTPLIQAPENVQRIRVQDVLVCLLWCLSSVVLTILNKLVLDQFRSVVNVLAIQMLVCVLLLKISTRSLAVDYLKLKILLPCALLFCVNCYTSTQAIAALNVPTFNVIRNMQCFMSCPLDYAVRNVRVSWYAFFSLLVVLAGSIIYCYDAFIVNTWGFAWGFANILGVCIYTIVIKTKFSQFGPVELAWYNNIGSLPIIAILAIYTNIASPDCRKESQACFTSLSCAGFLVLSSVGCFILSVSSFYSQEIMSPITWLLLNNINKIPSAVISYMIWSIKLTMLDLAGLLVSLVGGVMYSVTKLYLHQ